MLSGGRTAGRGRARGPRRSAGHGPPRHAAPELSIDLGGSRCARQLSLCCAPVSRFSRRSNRGEKTVPAMLTVLESPPRISRSTLPGFPQNRSHRGAAAGALARDNDLDGAGGAAVGQVQQRLNVDQRKAPTLLVCLKQCRSSLETVVSFSLCSQLATYDSLKSNAKVCHLRISPAVLLWFSRSARCRAGCWLGGRRCAPPVLRRVLWSRGADGVHAGGHCEDALHGERERRPLSEPD